MKTSKRLLLFATMAMVMASIFSAGIVAAAPTQITEGEGLHCPGAVDPDSPHYIAPPEGATVEKFEDDGTFTNEITLPAGTLFCVKAGDGNSGIWESDGSTVNTADLGLTNPQGTGLDISYFMIYTFENEAQWCSPGYWRQPQHLDSWTVDPNTKYNDVISSPSVPGDPTLLEVLQSPKVYGGEAFNGVGDYLSGLHPDVNFTGERVEDSCPLN
jgi:hypothetical protein